MKSLSEQWEHNEKAKKMKPEKIRYQPILPVIHQSPGTIKVSRKKQLDVEHVKRPLNKFMLFCKLRYPKIREQRPEMNLKDISKMIGEMWNRLSHDQQQVYEIDADDLKHLHKIKYPG